MLNVTAYTTVQAVVKANGKSNGNGQISTPVAPKPLNGFCVRWGHSPLPKKWVELPKFSAHVYCGQTAGWIKMPLGMDVGLSPGDFVLDGDSAPSPKRGRSPLPNFRQISTVPKRLDASRCHLVWREASAQGTVFRWGFSSPPPKGGGAPPHFSAHVYCGQTAG